MSNFFDFILNFFSQFGGGRGEMANELVHFGLASFFWVMLLCFVWSENRFRGKPREKLLIWGFLLGLLRDSLMFCVFSLQILGWIKMETLHVFFPPLEHLLAQSAEVFIAGAFLRYMLDNATLARRYLQVGIGVAILSYLATFWWWGQYITANPSSLFSQTWCDWVFHGTASISLVFSLFYLKKRKGWVRSLVVIALTFFLLDQSLKLVDMAFGGIYQTILAPIRHCFYLLAIPMFGYVYIVEQTDAHRQAQRDLQETGDFLQKIMESTSNAIFVLDLDGKFSHVNPAGKRMVGYSQKELIGMSFAHLVAPEDLPRMKEYFYQVASRGKSIISRETRLVHKKGYRVFITLSAAPMTQEGKTIGVVGTAEDITEIKEAEQQTEQMELEFRHAQKMEAVGRLAGGVAHDFNNILTVILGYVDLMTRHLKKTLPSDNSAFRDLKIIQHSSLRGANLARQLLIFSRKDVAMAEKIDLGETMESLEKMLLRLLNENISFKTILAPDLKAIFMDPGQLEQVIMNLVINAADAMPQGGNLTIETNNIATFPLGKGEMDREKPCVVLKVSDQGGGMDQKTMEKIFEPFFTTKPLGQGTGLGLSTVFGIVKEAGGHIDVESEVGKGTTFWIYFPPASEIEKKTAPPVRQIQDETGKETILLCEDDEEIRDMAGLLLQEAGYTVLLAKNGARGLTKSREHQGPLDLLITDMIMPDINGKELSMELLQERPDTKVLFMSGYTSDILAREKVEDLEFLPKPFTRSDLLSRVRTILNSHQGAKTS